MILNISDRTSVLKKKPRKNKNIDIDYSKSIECQLLFTKTSMLLLSSFFLFNTFFKLSIFFAFGYLSFYLFYLLFYKNSVKLFINTLKLFKKDYLSFTLKFFPIFYRSQSFFCCYLYIS